MENKEGGSIYISIFETPFENRKIRNHYRVRSEGRVSSAHTHIKGWIIFLQKKVVLTKNTHIFKSQLMWREHFFFLFRSEMTTENGKNGASLFTSASVKQ